MQKSLRRYDPELHNRRPKLKVVKKKSKAILLDLKDTFGDRIVPVINAIITRGANKTIGMYQLSVVGVNTHDDHTDHLVFHVV